MPSSVVLYHSYNIVYNNCFSGFSKRKSGKKLNSHITCDGFYAGNVQKLLGRSPIYVYEVLKWHIREVNKALIHRLLNERYKLRWDTNSCRNKIHKIPYPFLYHDIEQFPVTFIRKQNMHVFPLFFLYYINTSF